jgi:hypothetical protein
MRGAACAPSTSTGTPRAWASATISRTGLMVPSTFETCVTATRRVRSEKSAGSASSSSDPSSRIGSTRRRAARSSHSICQGTMFAWCSIVVTITSSPAPTLRRPQLHATRLIASVALRTKTISLASRAPRKARSFSRAPS